MRQSAATFIAVVMVSTLRVSATEITKTGTAFVASSDGHILTNAHVVTGCTGVITKLEGAEWSARVVAVDAGNDLALLKIERTFSNVPPLRLGRGVQLGESVAAFGFPLQGVLSTSLNMTAGNVSSLAGVQEDTRSFQFTAPIQPGNSGGPVVDSSGNVVGIATSKLSPLWTAVHVGDVPQNVNFALRVSMVRDFLESRGITPTAQQLSTPVPPTDLAKTFAGVTAQLLCLGTVAEPIRAEKRPGVLVAGFGAPADFFHAIYLDVQNTLAVFGVRVANKTSAFHPVSDDSISVPSLLELVRVRGSDSLLYITVERSGMNIRRVRLRCFDSDGKLLWEENASNSRQLFGNEEGAARYVMKELRKKLESHVGKPGLVLR